jgi:hypothetical protein
MLQVKIKNIASGQYTHGSKFETLELAQAWVSSLSNHPAFPWGKPEHQEESQPAVYLESGELISEAVYITVPSEFEVEIVDITAEVEAEATKQAKIAAGKAAREVCQQVLDLVAGYNLDRELTIEQITQMQNTFANAEASLRAGRPTYAKQFIAAIQADEVLVTQEMKDQCLELLQGY